MSTRSLACQYADEGKYFHDNWEAKPLWGRKLPEIPRIKPVKPSRGVSKWDPLVKVQQQKHFQDIAEKLCTLPPELFWPMLDGAPVGRILQLSACLADPTDFDRYITQQKQYQLVFPSPEHLGNLRNSFVVLFELRTVLDFVTIPLGSPLSRVPNERYKSKNISHCTLRKYIDSFIERIFRHQAWSQNEDLQQYLQTHYSHEWGHKTRSPLAYNASSADLSFARTGATRFDASAQEIGTSVGCVPFSLPYEHRRSIWCDEHEKSMIYSQTRLAEGMENAPEWVLRWADRPAWYSKPWETASEQLLRMADLVEGFPELLKMACDPQPLPRGNWRHLVHLLRAKASLILLYESKRNHDGGLFRFDMLPIVPSDDSLALFVAGMAKMLRTLPAELVQIVGCGLAHDPERPMVSDIYNDDNGNELIPVSSTISQLDTPSSKLCPGTSEEFFPSSVLEDIKTTVTEMAFVHTLPDKDTGIKPRVLRTRWTPWSIRSSRSPSHVAESPHQPKSPRPSSDHAKRTPIFLSPPAPHLDGLSPEKFDRQCLSFYTRDYTSLYSLEEFEWIEAYCRTVRFLEKIEHGGNFAYQQALDRQAEVDARIQRKWDRKNLTGSEYLDKYGVYVDYE